MNNRNCLGKWLRPHDESNISAKKTGFNLLLECVPGYGPQANCLLTVSVCGHASKPGQMMFDDKDALLEVLQALDVPHDVIYRALEGRKSPAIFTLLK